ncbi:hypothetical protein BST66_28790 [Bradyrhizobium canariense]|nr:hypothetical protein BST66_28790 [Bradyrhizobium canariense]
MSGVTCNAISNGVVFRIDNASIAASDNDHVPSVGMIEHSGVIEDASHEIADPWIGIVGIEADYQTFPKFALTARG